MVRKTLSVGTLGVVSFRSKKEKLRRAERELDKETRQREAAETRFSAAEKRLKHAMSQAEKSEEKLAKAKRRKRKDRAARLSQLVSTAEPIVHHTADAVRGASVEGAKRGRKAAREASREARKHAKRAAKSTRETVGPRAEKLAATVSQKVDDLKS
jgi:Tfp pilus assembly protein PilX